MNPLLFTLLIALITFNGAYTGRSWIKKKSDSYESYESYDDSSSYNYYKKKKPYYYKPKKRVKKDKCYPGIIQAFFGDLHDLPSGYQLCDGSNGTPDLRDRFLVGAGDHFAFGDEGGDVETALSVENLPSHGHGAGGLVTEQDGAHNHNFSAETHEGGHIHEVIDLHIAENGDHFHAVNLTTEKAGDHNHKFNAFSPESYDTYHADFDVPNQKVDIDKSYPIETSEDPGHKHGLFGPTEQAGLHSHDISGLVGGGRPSPMADGKHEHAVSGTTENAGIHNHEINGETAEIGDGEPFDILPPFNAIYWICCVKKEETKTKPTWYSY